MSYFRPNIDQMKGYVPGEQPRESEVIKLNTNENAYPPSPRVFEAIQRALTKQLRRYPDPLATEFRQAAAEVLRVSPDSIIACNGSDEALTLLTRACVEPSGLMVSPTPSYPLYENLAEIQGCRFEHRPFDEGGRLPRGLTRGAALTLVPNPNSPTGTFAPPEELLAHAEEATGLLVSDEAYADFALGHCLPLIEKCERLVVTRSFSKGYSLAGLRFGFLVAQPTIVRTLLKLKDSYNVDALAIAAATAAIRDQEYFLGNVKKILATRKRLASGLEDLGFQATPSSANFVWATRSTPLEPIYQELKRRGILIRFLRYPGFGEGLRVTVGTDAEIDRLLSELKSIV